MSVIVKETFAIDTDAAFQGYHIPGNFWKGFEQPSFTRTVAEHFATWYNEQYVNLHGYPAYAWIGDYLIYLDCENREDKAVDPIVYRPYTVTVGREVITVYDCGQNFCWTIADKTNLPVFNEGFPFELPENIDTIEQAQAYLRLLMKHNISFHPDDTIETDTFIGYTLTQAQADTMNRLNDQMTLLPNRFDACEFCLANDPTLLKYLADNDIDHTNGILN